MALKRGVLFSDDQKTASKNDTTEIEIIEDEITEEEKSISTEILEFIKFLLWHHEMKNPRIFLGIIIAIFITIQYVGWAENYYIKQSEKENKTKEIELIQQQINKLDTDMKKIKTSKKMKKYIHFKIDSLATIRENLKKIQ